MSTSKNTEKQQAHKFFDYLEFSKNELIALCQVLLNTLITLVEK